MEEDDGIDIREQINFEFNEDYSEVHTGHFEEENDYDLYQESNSNHIFN